MKNLLFPKQFQLIGWLLFVPAILLGILIYSGVLRYGGTIGTILNDAAIIGIVAGSIFIVRSKEKHEDEMIRSIRLASLLNSLYMYGMILITTVLLIDSRAFNEFMTFNLVRFP